jgi:Zn-dependent alcohol dehydrogenase
MEIRAAVCRATHMPVGIESIDIDRPLGREVLVRTVATGVCHSDLHVVHGDGRFPLDRGIVLGHEGAGIVEAVGDQVVALRPGDHVVACLSGFCGSCAQCLSVNTSSDDPVEAVRALTGRAGVDHAFEAVGNTTLVRQAIESLAIRGTATIVGVLPPEAKIEFPWMAIRPECRVQTSRMGGNRFRIDIPRYLDFYRQGRLLLDEMVTRRGRLDDLNEAFRAMKAGEVARTVLTFD